MNRNRLEWMDGVYGFDLFFFTFACLIILFFICLFEVVNVVRKGNGISFYGKTQIHELPYVTFACLCRWYLIYMRLIIPFTLLLKDRKSVV